MRESISIGSDSRIHDSEVDLMTTRLDDMIRMSDFEEFGQMTTPKLLSARSASLSGTKYKVPTTWDTSLWGEPEIPRFAKATLKTPRLDTGNQDRFSTLPLPKSNIWRTGLFAGGGEEKVKVREVVRKMPSVSRMRAPAIKIPSANGMI